MVTELLPVPRTPESVAVVAARIAGYELVDHPRDALALQWAQLWDFYRGDAAGVAGDRALYRVVADATPEVFYKLDGNVQTLRSFSAANASVAWAIGDGRRAMRSTDGGQTWATRAGLADRDFRSVLAIDTNTAWAVAGTGDLYKTIDGASTSAANAARAGRGKAWRRPQPARPSCATANGRPPAPPPAVTPRATG